MKAVSHNYFEISYILLKNGANPNLQDPWGDTALTFAVINKGYNLIQLLVLFGAHFNLIDDCGVDKVVTGYLFNENLSKEQKKIIKGRIRLAKTIDNKIKQALTNGVYINSSPNINDPDLSISVYDVVVNPFVYMYDMFAETSKDKALKDLMIWINKPDIVQVYSVLSNNNDIINRKDHRGITPLILSVSVGNLAMVRALLDSGADPTILCSNNKSALFQAFTLYNAMMTDENKNYKLFAPIILDIIKLLVRFGAKCDPQKNNIFSLDGKNQIMVEANYIAKCLAIAVDDANSSVSTNHLKSQIK